MVVIAGDVEPQTALKLAQETYGKVARHNNILPRQRPQEPPPVAVRSLTLADPRVEQPMMQRAYLVPSFATAKRGESEALEVLAHILGSGSNSRLYRTLVVDKHLAVAAGAWYDSSALDMSKFGVYGAPRAGRHAAAARSRHRRGDRRSDRQGRHAPRNSSAPRPG